MLRITRLDTPGLLRHIIIRGVKRCKIFDNKKDRANTIGRLSILLRETETQRTQRRNSRGESEDAGSSLIARLSAINS